MVMDPERIRAYLQAACAGLGFDVGEVWWTSNERGSSTVASIDDKNSPPNRRGCTTEGRKNLRFMQLYTSKSYDEQRCNLLVPPSEKKASTNASNATGPSLSRGDSLDWIDEESLDKHVLSPRLIDAISSSAELIWANCQKSEGFLGRCDMRLQTAIAMPVAMDSNGNMCIVVMFSQENVQSNDDAMEFLKYISKSAVSHSIPCLLPVMDMDDHVTTTTVHPKFALLPDQTSSSNFDRNQNMKEGGVEKTVPRDHEEPRNLGEGVVARYMSLDDENAGEDSTESTRKHAPANVQVRSNHELSTAPKDCFGIPMLPSFAELGNGFSKDNPVSRPDSHNSTDRSSLMSDAFDEASYGVWSTIMNTPIDGSINSHTGKTPKGITTSKSFVALNCQNNEKISDDDALVAHLSRENSSSTISMHNQMPQFKQERLEEFALAFLGMSVFDLADVWMPNSESDTDLYHVTSISKLNSSSVEEFREVSSKGIIKTWSGAVGRAFGSGNPVWSANKDVIVDYSRAEVFTNANIQTVLSVPVFSAGGVTPCCVFSCYSFVRSDSVQFVLRFVQKALRLLWEGLDHAVPHESLAGKHWNNVAPADLGEMAADMEMQEAFHAKKRPFDDISSPPTSKHRTSSIDLETVSDYNYSPISVNNQQLAPITLPTLPFVTDTGTTSQTQSPTYLMEMQGHIQQAVQAVGEALPWSIVHQSVATNKDGTKRAHRLSPVSSPQTIVHPSPSTSTIQYTSNQRVPLSYVNYSYIPSIKPNPPNAPITGTNPSHLPVDQYAHREDLSVALTNIEAFNAMARRGGGTSPSIPSSNNNANPANSWSTASLVHPGQVAQTANILGPKAVPNGISLGSNIFNASTSSYCLSANKGNVPMSLQLSGKPCRIQGCTDPGIARRPYCLKHSGNRLCEHQSCSKCAQGSTRFCIAHGGGRRCTFAGCDKGARDKFFCAAHGGGKRCSHEGCTKSAVGGSNLCTSHGGGKRCAVDGCSKSAQSSTDCCVKHGGGKKCATQGCGKVARGKTLFCAAHGGGVRCKRVECNRVAIGKNQLCRIHGGGATSRSKKEKEVGAVPSLADKWIPNVQV